jgi:hypothetical protein
MRKERKHYTAEEKVAILRRHLLDKCRYSLTGRLRLLVLKDLCYSVIDRLCPLTSEFGH